MHQLKPPLLKFSWLHFTSQGDRLSICTWPVREAEMKKWKLRMLWQLGCSRHSLAILYLSSKGPANARFLPRIVPTIQKHHQCTLKLTKTFQVFRLQEWSSPKTGYHCQRMTPQRLGNSSLNTLFINFDHSVGASKIFARPTQYTLSMIICV